MSDHSLRRSHGSRGNIALMACVFSVMAVLLMAATIEFGLLVAQKRQANQSTDAMAMAFALQARDYQFMYWSNQQFSPQLIKQTNLTSTDAVNSLGFTPPQADLGNSSSLSPLYIDAWTPIFITVRGQYQVHDTTAIGRMITGGGLLGFGSRLPLFTPVSKMRVSQAQLGTVIMMPERVALLLDFSKTMLLEYTGTGVSGQKKAYEVLRDAAKMLVDQYGQLVNIGVTCFSDGVTVDATSPLMTETTNMQRGNIENHQQDVLGVVNGANPRGDGTDLKAAVDGAYKSLVSAGGSQQNTAYQSAARIILITDGEPDKQGGSTAGDSGDRDQQIAYFRQKTLESMDAAWNSNTIAMGGATSDVMFIQRQGETGAKINGQSTADFLRSLSGTRTDHSGSTFLSDGGDPGAISNYIQNSLTVNPTCYMKTLNSINGLNRYPSTSRFVLPQQLANGAPEAPSAFFVPDIKRPNIEYPIKLYIDDLAGYNQAVATAGAYLDTSGQVPANFFDNSANQKKLIAFYDSRNQMVRTNGMLCAAFSTGSNLSDSHMRIRLRWGVPRPVAPDCVAAAETPSCNY